MRRSRADAAKAFTYADLDRAVQYSWLIESAVDDAYRLIAADAAGVRPSLGTAVMARNVMDRQNRGGDWPSHRQRPPSSYSNVTFTALGVRAIQLYAHPTLKAEVAKHVALARQWLLTHRPVDTEERTYQLLGLKWSGGDRATLDRLARDLVRTQEADGGWSSLDGRVSDAYSTGQVLVALHDAGGVPVTDARWQRGVDYLLKTQAADGSWHTATRLYPPAPLSPPYFESGLPYGHDQFLSGAGRRVGGHGARERARRRQACGARAVAGCRAGECRAVGRDDAVRIGWTHVKLLDAGSIRMRRRSPAARRR